MDAQRWDKLGSLIVEVLALPPEERDDFLGAACGSDAALRAEAESLLAAYDEAPTYFESLGEGLIPRMEDLEEPPPEALLPDPHQLIGQAVAHYQVFDVAASRCPGCDVGYAPARQGSRRPRQDPGRRR